MLEKVLAALGGIAFLQFPQLYLQYLHELKGHIAELKYQIRLFEQAAHLSGKNLTEWIAKFVQNGDPDFVLQGNLLQGMVDRLITFQQAERTLELSSLFNKPFVFIRMADYGVLQETLRNFQWGLSLTIEGIVYGCLGMLIGYGLCKTLRMMLTKLRFKNAMNTKT